MEEKAVQCPQADVDQVHMPGDMEGKARFRSYIPSYQVPGMVDFRGIETFNFRWRVPGTC